MAWRRWCWSPSTTTGSGASRVTGRSGAAATASLQASAASTARSTGRPLDGPGLVEPGQQQQVLDQCLHAGRLLLDAAHDHRQVDPGRVARSLAEAEQLGEALDRGERRAQLVRGVGQELAEPVLGPVALGEGRLDLVEHRVEGQAELADLAAAFAGGDPLGEVAGGDGPGRRGHLLQRAQAPAEEEPGAAGQQGQQGDPGRALDEDRRRNAEVTSVRGTATTTV